MRLCNGSENLMKKPHSSPFKAALKANHERANVRLKFYPFRNSSQFYLILTFFIPRMKPFIALEAISGGPFMILFSGNINERKIENRINMNDV